MSFNYTCDTMRRLPLYSLTQINLYVDRINCFGRKDFILSNILSVRIKGDHDTTFSFLFHMEGSSISEFLILLKISCHR